ncbi:MAG: isocitrate lyase/phosphoenolpyruvate mutase family protein [Corynebacterium sp.]|nr:isocitrate lyase/phosphoenolpyruvate mutase family protein [Corynebacterium sp.]
MSNTTAELARKATRLLDLHHDDAPVVLPTVWDAWSARLAEDAGFTGLTVGSHPVADSLGYDDGENTPVDLYFQAVARITGAVDVPVSVDVESGLGLQPAELVRNVLDAGAVGVNIEDTVHTEDRYRSPEEHAAYIAAVRAAADAEDVHLVINGRTDAFTKDGEDAALLDDALPRLRLMQDAGADSLYPVKIPSQDVLTQILDQVSVPLNVTAHPRDGAIPGAMSLADAARAGVGRISFGPLLQAALADTAGELLNGWRG